MKLDYQARREGDRRRSELQDAWDMLKSSMEDIMSPFSKTDQVAMYGAIKDAEWLSQALIDWYNWKYDSRNWREDS